MQTHGKLHAQFRIMENGDYTIKLQNRCFNIKNKEEVYVATDIYEGLTIQPRMRVFNYSAQQATENSCAQVCVHKITQNSFLMLQQENNKIPCYIYFHRVKTTPWTWIS